MARQFFEWDPRKAKANRKKHQIEFDVARRVFNDPLRDRDIEGDEHGEVRWRTVGEIDGTLYVVSHTIREEEDEEGEIEIIRIISARRATPRESRKYREAP